MVSSAIIINLEPSRVDPMQACRSTCSPGFILRRLERAKAVVFILPCLGLAYSGVATIYQDVTDRILTLIEEQRTLPWRKPWQLTPPANAVSRRPYRGINALILSSSNFMDHRWLTFQQARELGGNVRKGEKATQVVLWQFDDESEEEGEAKRRAPLVRTYSVFNASQCENLKLAPLAEREITVEPTTASKQLLKSYVGGPRVTHGGDQACYVPSQDRVQMPPVCSFPSEAAYFATLAHELVHSTGAANRLNREGVTSPIYFGSASYAEEELVAEIGAAFLSAEYGIPNVVDYSAAYIDGWLHALRRDNSMIVKAAAKAQRAADLIVGRKVS